MYIKDELSYEVVRKHMEGDLMPEIWLRLGHKGTRRTLIGMVYRKHTPWKSKESGGETEEVARSQAPDMDRKGRGIYDGGVKHRLDEAGGRQV